ncbi:ABC transporter ATP-binding protein [Desulfosporosinus meridiei]|uniref:Oligopeptide/dipeptide ABC transporter, ATP-binding protein n=1 Tax=Desulfosporosinus meridiei (strain ATCC BAA-275 / DSM 13257 / KCTC 12902 / NCIMB 13706 / S10) TaxID=768704 RepID=J7IQZ5_DESMD|nr:ABC transporter ATP-binding protein [Desulfosporosinus meridiei]AFQ42604.1 oligopeptide/dipeptide ABC transporter, ATP-binding protein [Desulfosporosinus meridiei DSM 13257]
MKQALPLLEVLNLAKYYEEEGGGFKQRRKKLRALDGVSFDLKQGETLGLVGESGCGKSTLGRLLVRLEKSDQGQILYEGTDVTAWQGEKLRQWRRNVQMIFQDAFASLNPRLSVEEIIRDPLRNYEGLGAREMVGRVEELLEMVGLEPSARFRYPLEFSGGQRQRIAIARALALGPRLLVCDECVASLDVSIQAQILQLIQSLKEKLGLSLLFISHDLAVINYISDRVAVMYLGKIVEILESGTLVEEARHPYTQALFAAVPLPDPAQKSVVPLLLQGEPPNLINPPSGCSFHPRCPQAMDKCRQEEPAVREISPKHWVACHGVS